MTAVNAFKKAVIAAIAAMFCGIAVFVIRHHVAR